MVNREPIRYVAILLHRTIPGKLKSFIVPKHQTLDFDEGAVTREWLRPHLGDEWLLDDFVPCFRKDRQRENEHPESVAVKVYEDEQGHNIDVTVDDLHIYTTRRDGEMRVMVTETNKPLMFDGVIHPPGYNRIKRQSDTK